MARADGLLLFGAACLLVLVQAAREPRPRRLLLGLAAGTVPVLVVLVSQRLYYGRWLPNTFQAKIAGGATDLGRGLGYIWRSFAHDTLNAPLLLGALLGLWTGRRESAWRARAAHQCASQ